MCIYIYIYIPIYILQYCFSGDNFTGSESEYQLSTKRTRIIEQPDKYLIRVSSIWLAGKNLSQMIQFDGMVAGESDRSHLQPFHLWINKANFNHRTSP